MAEPAAAGPAPDDAPPTDAAPLAGSRRRVESRALVEIVALCGLVITQPLLDVTGKSPDFFLFHGAGRRDILLLVAAYTVLPPLVLWGTGAVLGLLGRRVAGPARGGAVRAVLHTVTLGLLLAALAIQVGKQLTPVRGAPLVVLAVAGGAAGAYAYRRWQVTGQVLRVAAVGPLVFVLLFVFASPASAVVLPGERSGAGAGASRGGVRHPPVVMLILDEFPLTSLLDASGAIDARRYPNFARLAGESTWYRNATGVSGYTPYALPAMLTGRYPGEQQAPHHSRYPDNLFTAFAGPYQIQAQESITQLCPPRVCPDRAAGSARGGLPTLLRESATLLQQIVSPSETGQRDPEDSYREITRREAGDADDPPPTDPQFRFGALDENQPARFADFLATLRPTVRPTLHFLHLLLPHSPYNYLPSGIRYGSPDGMPNDGDGWVELAYRRYLLQVEYTDRLLGETLRRLDETGLYDDALVVLTADHGVSFTPGVQGRGLGAVQRVPGEVLWVPLFVKRPGQRAGAVDDRNWEHVDLLPTVADLAGVEVPWRTDGASALRTTRAPADKHYYDQPGQPRMVPAGVFADVVAGRAGPVLPAQPRPDLIGRSVAELPLGPEAGSVTVRNRSDFDQIDQTGGRLPALVYGTVPDSVPNGALLAVAVNGRIGAVAPVVPPDPGGQRFGALVTDESLFLPGRNTVDVFQVTDAGTLRPLRD
ncbi:sulfatase-like hydrolase/transferase [Plantactinospora sp. KLBMP9567]|uniref:sulfatase-like hydrolase/transferase n=1 Tax=Plantactinospora sp. KLBMP9567 TaxID=3085900 RepID=UPI002981E14F|nr:sulfatase-like hydrolase/transferase [Plantactinospora sp. KLBMP9567]MDW5322694.1 sulfatase-like hydrolase/transferase [Plantactinospora sp. KLBMP9567]